MNRGARHTLLRAGLAWVSVTAATLLVVAVTAAALGPTIAGWDHAALDWLHARRDPTLIHLSHLVTMLGKPSASVPLTTFAVLAFLGARRPRDAAWVLLSCLGAGSAYLALLPIFHRQRPETYDVTGLSLPSGHAAATLALVLPSAIAAWRAWRWKSLPVSIVGFGAALIVGATRPYIQYHFVSDVLVAWAMTVAWVIVLDRWVIPREISRSSSCGSSSTPPSSRASLRRRRSPPSSGP